VLGYSTLDAGLAIIPAAVLMVLIAPRSAKLVSSRGARVTLLVGYAFCLLGFLTMLLLWKESIAYWNGLWRYPSFRRTQRVISIVWGVAFLAEAGLRVALSYLLSTSAMAVVSSLMPVAVIAALVTWTMSYGRRARAAGLAAAAAAPAAAAASQEAGAPS